MAVYRSHPSTPDPGDDDVVGAGRHAALGEDGEVLEASLPAAGHPAPTRAGRRSGHRRPQPSRPTPGTFAGTYRGAGRHPNESHSRDAGRHAPRHAADQPQHHSVNGDAVTEAGRRGGHRAGQGAGQGAAAGTVNGYGVSGTANGARHGVHEYVDGVRGPGTASPNGYRGAGADPYVDGYGANGYDRHGVRPSDPDVPRLRDGEVDWAEELGYRHPTRRARYRGSPAAHPGDWVNDDVEQPTSRIPREQPTSRIPREQPTSRIPREQPAPQPSRQRRRKKTRRAGDVVRAGVRGFGELLITFGLLVLLFAGYEVYGKAAQVNEAQDKMDNKLENAWGSSEKPKPAPGEVMARLYIPRLDKDWVVVEGVQPKHIKNGPGHFPRTALPGEVGNFSLAGHRMPAVFWDLDQMKKGNAIIVEDQTHWYVYRVTETKITSPYATERVAKVPGDEKAEPKDPYLTLMTCNPRYDNYERLWVHAKMERKQLKTEGRPAELPAD